MTTSTDGQLIEDPTSEAALVSIGTELLREGPVVALITAVLAENDNIEPDELRHHIVESWINGTRPTRAVANKWGQEAITKAAYRHVGYQSRVPDPSNMNPDHVTRIPIDVSRRHHMILVALDDEEHTAEICAADPTNSAVRDEATFHLPNYTITWLVATDNAISAALNAIATRSTVDESEFITDQTDNTNLGFEEDDADSGIVNYLNSLFNEAFANEASDIHLFPQPNGYEVRFRRDGVLVHRENIQERFGRGLVSRIRVMCQIRMSSNTKQDGGAAINVNNRRIDLRVSIIPSIWALPAVTIRLLASRAELMDLKTLYDPRFISHYLSAVDLPDGFNLVVGRTGDGKPVSVDAVVFMGDGTQKRLGDVNVGDTVITHKGRARTVNAVFEQGHLPGVRIETVHGRVTTAALDHPFLTPEGWVEAQDLEPGMALANVATPVWEPSTTRTDAEFVLAGLMVGDGSCTGYNASWNDRKQRWQHRHLNPTLLANDEIAKAMMAACDDLGFGYHLVDTGTRDTKTYSLSGGVREWLRDVGLAGKKSVDKTVPEFVFRGTPTQIALFLGAYLATDGTVKFHQSAKGGPKLKGLDYYSTNRALLVQVQHLLLRLGIQSFLSPKNALQGTNFTAGVPYTSWRLFIGHDWDACARTAALIPIPGPKGGMLAQYARHQKRFPEPLLGDEITTITSVDAVECRCLTVDEDHTFTVDDLVVHNTTSLAATLNAIATPERKACSIEDPVENRLPHIVQVQVNEEAGLTYDEGMKAFLRSDPDIIMVGEIRDQLTARISIQAAQTGHLVFGTLHIRDSASAPGRLIRDFGIEPAAIADTLNSVLAQRLVRCVCRDCRVQYQPSGEELDGMHWPEDWPSQEARFFTARPGGCMNCKHTGYRGRKAAPELLVISPDIQEAIVANEPGFRIREIALSEGMSPMWNTALGLAARGETTFEEIRRILRTSGRH